MTEAVLREALEAALRRVPERALSEATARLVEVYRSGAPPESLAVRTEVDAAAYAAYRMPATYAAVSRALGHVADVLPNLVPTRLLDVGGGTGAGSWAAVATWPTLARITVLDASAPALAAGRRIAAEADHPALTGATWQQGRLPQALPTADVALISYVLGELDGPTQERVLDDLMAAAPLVVVVEPGTPRGYAATLSARSRLLDAGWSLVGPCPHEQTCPLTPGDWCHDVVRLQRSALHRRVKGGTLGHEDEKLSWVAALQPDHPKPALDGGRVLRHPVLRKGLVQLELCRPDGTAGRAVVSKRQGTAYKNARDARWGDLWPTPERPD